MTSEPEAVYCDERKVLILYATETGNAYEVAIRVANEAKRRHFLPQVRGMDQYSIVVFPFFSLQ